jgi:hypothetical protein
MGPIVRYLVAARLPPEAVIVRVRHGTRGDASILRIALLDSRPGEEQRMVRDHRSSDGVRLF